MNILNGKNITRALITLIVIFGVIFIIVGERPRHKADVKNPTKQTDQTINNQNLKPDNTASKLTNDVTPQTIPEIKSEVKIPTEENNKQETKTKTIDGKKLISQKYKNSDKTFMQKAIEMHNLKKADKLKAISNKDDTDSEISETGLAVNSQELSTNVQNENKIQKEENVDSAPVKSLTNLSEPDVKESSDINPAIIKEQDLQDKYPLRYSSSTAADTSTIYLIDTATAQVAILEEGSTHWINLGKPENAEPKPVSTYTLEGATKNSAIIMDVSTAESWRVTISKDDIKWTVIKPFKTNN